MIQFKDISKSFKGTQVLENIDLTIEGEEFICLTGASGAGKSTLIHLLIGAEKPDSGDIEIDTWKVNTLKTKDLQKLRRKIGVVFQNDHLLPNKTAAENIAFALEICGETEPHITKKVFAVAEIVGIKHILEKFPRELSGGERQKVAIARALTNEPHLFIADEPTGNLDPDSTREIIEILKKINKNVATVILATHNTSVVDNLQTRVIRIENGKIASDKIGGY